MDIVVFSMLIILPLLLISYKKVKVERNYNLHKRIQLIMFIILFFVVLLFEYDMKQHGGIFEMVKGSAYEGTFFLNFMIYFPYVPVHHHVVDLDRTGDRLADQVWKKSQARKIQQNAQALGKNRYVGHGADVCHRVDFVRVRICTVAGCLTG